MIYYLYQKTEVILIKICPYLEASFQILGRKWNGLIIHYLSQCKEGSAHFTEMKNDLTHITPRALSLKLTELAEHELIEKKVTGTSPVIISYHLTEKGNSLAAALEPIQKWAQSYQIQNSSEEHTKGGK
jgi:DNA-binding HxlR family transcriptional regulator